MGNGSKHGSSTDVTEQAQQLIQGQQTNITTTVGVTSKKPSEIVAKSVC